MSNPLEEWLTRLADALGVDPGVVDIDLVLDLARDAAHGVSRPAAPLTTFLVGFAAGSRGGSQDEIAAATQTARRLAAETE
jgi:hypothetical protein